MDLETIIHRVLPANLLLVRPNVAVDHSLIDKEHDCTVGHHTNKMRAKSTVKSPYTLLTYDCFCAVNDTAIMPTAKVNRKTRMKVRTKKGLKTIVL